MKFSCIRCGRFICNLDMRKFENKEEHPMYCSGCLKETLDITKGLFTDKKK